MPHIVSMQKPKDIGGDGRRGNVDVMDGGSVDLTVVCGTIKRQPPFYIGIGGVEMGPDIPRRRLAAVVLDTEWNEGGASVMFEARRCWRYGSGSWASSVSRMRRLWRVSGASSIWYLSGSTTSVLRSVDRSVRLGRLGVCPECLMAEVGKRLDYIEVRITERWINTQGESACQALKGKRKEGTLQSIPTKEDEVQGLYKVCTERMYRGCCRGSTKYTTRTE
jgi:hypothetical protein